MTAPFNLCVLNVLFVTGEFYYECVCVCPSEDVYYKQFFL